MAPPPPFLLHCIDVSTIINFSPQLKNLKTYILLFITFSEGIAVDWVNNKLYFTDRSLDIVGVFDPINSYYTVLIETGQLSEPRAIVLDPEKR